jgi:hypothetical protein
MTVDMTAGGYFQYPVRIQPVAIPTHRAGEVTRRMAYAVQGKGRPLMQHTGQGRRTQSRRRFGEARTRKRRRRPAVVALQGVVARRQWRGRRVARAVVQIGADDVRVGTDGRSRCMEGKTAEPRGGRIPLLP